MSCDECDRLGRAVVQAERYAKFLRSSVYVPDVLDVDTSREAHAKSRRLTDALSVLVRAVEMLEFHEADAHG